MYFNNLCSRHDRKDTVTKLSILEIHKHVHETNLYSCKFIRPAISLVALILGGSCMSV